MKQDHTMDFLAVLMLAYQGWRVVDYMQNGLADVPSLTRWMVSISFLAFTEIALLVWLHRARPRATTDAQELVASVMIWVDFVLSMVIGLGDLAQHNRFYTVDLSLINPILFAAPWLTVVCNIGAYLLYHMTDSNIQLERAERQLEHAEHQLEIQARQSALKLLGNGRAALAEKLAPHYANRIEDDVTGRTLARFLGEHQPPALPQDIPVSHNAEPPAQLNGKAENNQQRNF